MADDTLKDDNVFSLPARQTFDATTPLPAPCPETSFVGYFSGNVSRRRTGEWVCQVVILPEYQEEFNKVIANSQQVLMFTVAAWLGEGHG